MPPEETNAPVAETPAATAAVPVIETATILTPASEPVVVAEVAPAAVEAPAAEATPEAAPAEAPKGDAPEGAAPAEPESAVKSHTETPSLMETAGKKDDKKPDEGKKPEGDAPKTDEPAAKTYEPFKLPEGVTPDETKLNAFRELAGKHNLDQEAAQSLVDLHSQSMQAFADHMANEQHRVFAETRKGWVEKIKADPILGGAGHATALQAAARMRDLLIPEAHRGEFDEFMRVTGAGDHPALFRLLHTAARLFDEPAPPPIPARPTPDRGGSAPTKRSDVLYDHPTSRRAAGR